MTPEETLLLRNLAASGLPSAEWARIPAALRDRAFFSSRVESVRFLDACRTRIAELLAAAKNADGAVTSRAQAVSDIMRTARRSGIATGRGGLLDPGSAARAALIVDTNAAMAAGYARAEIANAYGARLAFPAQELVRVEPRRFPRNWPAIWQAHGGTLHRGRMVALKDDPVWLRISRFGHPYPPFDFNSGMGVEDVSRDEAVDLGVIPDDYRPPEESPLAAFNDGLQAEVAFRNDGAWQALRRAFGDLIRQKDGKIAWRNDLIREAFTSNKPFTIRLGEASGALLDKLPESIPAQALAGKQLTVTQTWLDNKRKDGTDHRAHFYPLESDPRNIPLTVEDLERIPSIWREPDAVRTGTSSRIRILLEQTALDGGVYKMVVDIKNSPYLVTLFKNKAPAE